MSKECQHEFTDIAVCVHCGCDTDGYISSRRTEPKGQGGLVAEFRLRRDPLNEGYYGHELGCDCAVCEDVAQRESFRKTADAEWNKLMDENKRYCDALHIIAHMGVSGLSWQHDFEKCVNIAREALADRP